jgi:hypothetical protein
VCDSEKKIEQDDFAFSFLPNVRQVIEPHSWSRPPHFLVQAGDAIVNERLRKAFCAEIRRPLVLLRSYTIPTPASFGESRESLEVRRAETKRAGYRFDSYLTSVSLALTLLLSSYHQIEGNDGHYRANPATGIWEIQLTAEHPLPLKNFPTDVIRVRSKDRDPSGGISTKVVSFVVHKRVLAAFFAHLGPKLSSSVLASRLNCPSTTLVRCQWLPVFTVLNGRPDVYKFLFDYVYEHDPETVLRALLGDRVFPQVLLCTEEIYQGTPRTISALPIAERRAAVQIQGEHGYGEIVNVLAYLDEIYNLADELGLDSPPFWNALTCARRIILDAGAISYFHHLKAMAEAEAVSCA